MPMKSRRDICPELDNQSRAGVVACAAGLVMLVAAAMVLRAANGPAALVGIVLAMWGIGGIAFGLARILHLGG